MPEASNVGARLVCLSSSGYQSWEDGGVVSIAVYGSKCLYPPLTQLPTMFARSWLRGPTLQLVAVIDWGGGKLLFVNEDVADIA